MHECRFSSHQHIPEGETRLSACQDKMRQAQPPEQAAVLLFDLLNDCQKTCTVDGQLITIDCGWQKAFDGQSGILELRFTMDQPARFAVTVKIPDNCLNACLTLNGQSLLGWFSDVFPLTIPDVPTSPCAGHSGHVTPLWPGRLQTLNFRWQNGDCLRMIVILD